MAIIIPKSTAQLTTKGTANLQTPSDFSKVERSLQGLGRQVSAVSNIFRNGIITEQVSKATLNANQKLNDLQITTLQNPNLTESSATQFRAEADKILAKEMDGIGDPIATREFQVQHQGAVLSRENAVRKAGRTQQIDRYDVQTSEIGEQALDNSYNTNNPATQEIERQKYIGQLNRGVENLWKSRVERQRQITEWDEARRVGKAQHDYNILTAPGEGVTWSMRAKGADDFIKIMQEGTAYPELSTGEQLEHIKKAKQFRDVFTERSRVEIEGRQFTEWQTILPRIKSGDIDEPELRLLNLDTEPAKDSGLISNAQLTKALALISSKKGVNVKTDNGVFHDIEKAIYGQVKNPATNDFWTHTEISDLIDDNALNLDEEDMQQLIKQNTTAKRDRTKLLISAASKGLEGRIIQQVVRSDDILFGTKDPITGLITKAGLVGGDVTSAKAAKAVADEYMARFHRQIATERVSTQEDIRKIELEIENEFRKENDLSLVGGDQPNITINTAGEVIRLFEGKSNVKPRYTVTENPVDIGEE